MKFDKKVMESGVVVGFAIVMAVSTAFAGNVAAKTLPDSREKEFTAVAATEEAEVATIQKKEVNLAGAGWEEIQQTAGAEGTETAPSEAQKSKSENLELPAQKVSQEVSPWAAKLMPNVEDFLNIRTEASDEAEVAGKLYKGALAEVLERGDTWTRIRSGSVEGYVKNELCVTGFDAENMANAQGTTYATVLTGGVRIRAAASSDENTQVLDVAAEGVKLEVARDAAPAEGWIAVKVEDQAGYVSAQFVSVELELGKAISIEEEQAAIAAAEAEKARKAAEEAQKAEQAKKAQKASRGTRQKEAVSASYDDVTLLGALIQCEAGSESYEGKLAVGAVVMNRLRAGYAGSISGVIYQSGQFSPASSGKLSRVLSGGVSGSCLQAAQEAINGSDNVGGAKNFKRASSVQSGTVIGNHVFF